jgi:hypothetical protein
MLLAEELNARIAYIDELEIKLVCMPCEQTWTDCCNAVKEEVIAIELRH